MMSEQTDNILSRLNQFGLEVDEARIYLDLLENRSMTALGLSRNLGIARTRVYRLLDKLIDKSLVIQKLESSGWKFIASEPGQLKNIVAKKESELESLKKSVEETKNLLEQKLGPETPGSKILYYRGQDGLSRVNWNLLNTKSEILSYEVSTMYDYIPKNEAERLTREMISKKISMRTISNKNSFGDFPEMDEETKRYWSIRYVPRKMLDIKTDVFIYDDVFAVCHYLEKGDVFCFEMQNKQVTEMQRQMFEVVWAGAAPLT